MAAHPPEPSTVAQQTFWPETGERLAPPTLPRLGGPASFPDIPGFDILDVLGRGGMGVVYLARDRNLGREVALKMILGHAGVSALARFRTEAEAAARLSHPHIVPVFGWGEHDGVPFLTLGYLPGGTLSARLASSPLAPRDAAALVRTLALAVQAAHDAGVVHRDIKPGNILFDAAGAPHVADFGLARKLDADSGLSRAGDIIGTPSYMAPEQARGLKDAGPPADVYALGAVLYECLTGRPPFRAANVMETLAQVVADDPVPPRQLNGGLPRDIETICLKCLHKEPSRRYPSAKALADDLGRWLDGLPIEARPAGIAERVWKWGRRNPVAVAFMAALAVSAGVALWAARAEGARAGALADKAHAEEGRREAERLRQLDGARLGIRMALQRGGVREALALFGRAEADGLEPTADMRLDRARALMAARGSDEGLAELARIDAGTLPDGLRANHLLLSGAALAGQDDARSAALLRQALALSAHLSPADRHYARGVLAPTTPETLRYLQAAVQEDPAHLDARAMLGFTLFALGRIEEMLEVSRGGRLLAPDHPAFQLLPALGEATAGRLDRATPYVEEMRRSTLNKEDVAALEAILPLLAVMRSIAGAPDPTMHGAEFIRAFLSPSFSRIRKYVLGQGGTPAIRLPVSARAGLLELAQGWREFGLRRGGALAAFTFATLALPPSPRTFVFKDAAGEAAARAAAARHPEGGMYFLLAWRKYELAKTPDEFAEAAALFRQGARHASLTGMEPHCLDMAAALSLRTAFGTFGWPRDPGLMAKAAEAVHARRARPEPPHRSAASLHAQILRDVGEATLALHILDGLPPDPGPGRHLQRIHLLLDLGAYAGAESMAADFLRGRPAYPPGQVGPTGIKYAVTLRERARAYQRPTHLKAPREVTPAGPR